VFEYFKRILKHSIIYGVAGVTSQIIGFLLVPVYTRYLTPKDYGVLAIINVSVAIAAIVLNMGMSSSLFKSYFNHEDEESRKAVVSTAFLFHASVTLVLTTVLIVFAKSSSALLFGTEKYSLFLVIAFLSNFFNIALAIPLAVFRAREESRKYAAVTLFNFAVGIGFNILFVVVLLKGVIGVLQAGLIANFLTYLALIPNIVRRVKIRFSIAELKEMLGFGLPLVPANLAAWILTLSDRYFLKYYSSLREVGLYSLGYKFGTGINILIVIPFSLAWVPFMLSVAKEKNAKEVYSYVLTYFFLVGTSLALGLSVLAKDIIAIIATPRFYSAHRVIPMVALSYVLYGCYYIFSTGIYLEKKTKYVPIIVGFAATLNLVLNFLLIPPYGMMGAAVATLVSYFVLMVEMFFVSQRYYEIRYDFVRILKILTAAGLIYAASRYAVSSLIIVDVIYKLPLLLSFFLLLFIFKFYEPRELEKLREILKAASSHLKRKQSELS